MHAGKVVASEKHREPPYIAHKIGVIGPRGLACQIFNDSLEFGATANLKRTAIDGSSATMLLRICVPASPPSP